MALRAAEAGRRTVVLTIDPARRLAQSMGLTELDNTPRPVKGIDGAGRRAVRDDARHEADVRRGRARALHARTGPKQIFANPFYQALSSSFAGHAGVHGDGEARPSWSTADEWDLIVVDTPPSRSALDFLDAPQRLGRFLDGRMIRLLTAPARAGGRAYLKVVTAGVRGVHQGAHQDPRRRAALRRVGVRRPRSRRCSAASGERAEHTYELLKAPGHGVRRRGRARAGRAARGVVLRRAALGTTTCRSPG